MSKSGAITRPRIPVDYTIEQLAEWLRLLQVASNVWACAYCNKRLVLSDVEIDHKDPLASGGSGGLDNQTPACKLCNQTKGELTAVAYMRLLAVLRTLDWSAELYVLTALRMVGIAKRQRFFPRKPSGSRSSTSY